MTSSVPMAFGLFQHACIATRSSTCTPKPSSTSNAFFQLFHNNHLWGVYPFENKLCHPVSFLNLKIDLRVIEQQYLHLPSIIRINDSRSRINKMFRCQSAPWRYSSIGSRWHRDRDTRRYQSLSPRRYGYPCTSIYIISRREGTPSRRCLGRFAQLLDE